MVKAKEPNLTKGKRRAGQTVRYLRVSALDQKELRQLEGIKFDKRFTDKALGKDMHWPQLQLRPISEGESDFHRGGLAHVAFVAERHGSVRPVRA